MKEPRRGKCFLHFFFVAPFLLERTNKDCKREEEEEKKTWKDPGLGIVKNEVRFLQKKGWDGGVEKKRVKKMKGPVPLGQSVSFSNK